MCNWHRKRLPAILLGSGRCLEIQSHHSGPSLLRSVSSPQPLSGVGPPIQTRSRQNACSASRYLGIHVGIADKRIPADSAETPVSVEHIAEHVVVGTDQQNRSERRFSGKKLTFDVAGNARSWFKMLRNVGKNINPMRGSNPRPYDAYAVDE